MCIASPPTLSLFNFDNGVQAPLSSFVSLNGFSISVNTQDLSLQGIHLYKLTAVIPTAQFLTGSSAEITYSINFKVVACTTAQLQTQRQSFSSIRYDIRTQAVTQQFLPFQDTVALQTGITDICGPRFISVSPSLPFV